MAFTLILNDAPLRGSIETCTPATWPPARDSQARRAALREFLKCRRARLSAADYGIFNVRQRRTRGLRQEDVAKLVGVSSRWYEVFESGKSARRFSAAFVARVADVLRLDRPARAALNRLALPEVAETVEHFERLAFLRTDRAACG